MIVTPLLIVKSLRYVSSYQGMLEIPRIRMSLNRTLIIMTLLFLLLRHKSLIRSNSSYLMLILILLHLISFVIKDMMLLLLLSDFILCWITLRFRLYHSSTKELTSNIYLIYYVMLPSAPLLFIMLREWSKRNSSSVYITYGKDFLFTTRSRWFGLIILLSRLAKLPIFGLHYWLPKAHVQAPTLLSIVLARLSLKVRLVVTSYLICNTVFIDTSIVKNLLTFLLIRLFFSVYTGISATDPKVFLAYCSVAHISTRCIRIIIIASMRFYRAWLLRLRHCLSSPLLFYIVGNSQYSIRTRILIPTKRVKFSKITFMLLLLLLIDLPFPPIFSFWREVWLLNQLFLTYRLLSCCIILPIVILIRRYEYIYTTLREYICSSVFSIYLRSLAVMVTRAAYI